MIQTRLAVSDIPSFRLASTTMILWALTTTLAIAAPVADAWTQVTKLTSGTPTLNEQFGNSVAIDDNWIVVGAGRDSSYSFWGGSVYFYPRLSDSVGQPTRFLASDARSRDQFGRAVDIDGNWAIVGASGAGINANNSGDYGGAYFFKYSNDSWNEMGRVNALDYGQNDGFGAVLAIDGDRAVIGSHWDDHSGYQDAGSAYIFERSGDNWTQVAKLTASDPAKNNHFGNSVAIDGDRVLVGAYFNSHAGGDYAGAAYVYEFSGETWSQVEKLTADDAQEADYFGASVALDCDRALIGAERADVNGKSMAGSAYVFESLNGWTQTAKLIADDSASPDHFGGSVTLEGDRALIGSQHDNDGRGSAYVFEIAEGIWNQEAKLTAADGRADDGFGLSIDLDGNWAVTGARFDDYSDKLNAGSAYVFAIPEPSTLALLSSLGTFALGFGWWQRRRGPVRPTN